MTSTKYFRARHVATMVSSLIEDGCVAVQGDRIIAVGPTRDINPPQIDEDIDGLLMPGLINAHTHLELSDRTPGEPPTNGFAGWLVGMLQRTRIEVDDMERLVTLAISIGVEQCRKFGVTAVGDISRQCHLSRPLLRDAPLRVVSFGEVQAMAQRRGLLNERVAAAIDTVDATYRLQIGITPHAPYSVEADGYRYCLEVAQRLNLPLATHLAESPDETPFLLEHSGALRELWNAWLSWDDKVPRFAGGPIKYAQSLGLLDYPTLLAHVNYCSDADLRLLAAGKAAVVWCPRTHKYFGHPPHRWREMRGAGITVCIGTDSCASSPDLNIVDDLRLVRHQCPEETAEALWALVTTSAANALRWNAGRGTALGRLSAGAMADFVAWPTTSNDPLMEVLDAPEMLPLIPLPRGEVR